jgi:hypothetical protein
MHDGDRIELESCRDVASRPQFLERHTDALEPLAGAR